MNFFSVDTAVCNVLFYKDSSVALNATGFTPQDKYLLKLFYKTSNGEFEVVKLDWRELTRAILYNGMTTSTSISSPMP